MKTTVKKIVALFLIIGLFSFPQFSMAGSIAIAADADVTAPTYISPSAYSNFPVNGNITFKFSEHVNLASGFDQISLKEKDSTATIALTGGDILSNANNELVINPPTDLKYNTEYVVTIPANLITDDSGNAYASEIIHSFKTESQSQGGNDNGGSNTGNSPTVVSQDPSIGATGVGRGSSIRVTFGDNIQKDSGFSNIRLENPNGANVDVSVSIDGKVLIIDPFLDMRRGGKYTVIIPSGAVKYSNGNPNAYYSYTFNVSSSSDTGPVIVQTTPRDDAEEVAPSIDVVIKYDVSFDRGSSYNDIALKDSNGNKVPMSLTTSNKSLSINPTHDLPGLVTYTVVIPTSAVKDSSGDYSENQYIFKFKVAEDDDAPDAPSNLSASNTSSATTIQLDWKANSEADVDGYNIYRKLKTGYNYTKLNSSLVTANTYKDTSIQAGQAYSYYVAAYDKSDNESNRSNIVDVTGTSVNVLGATVTSDVSSDAWYASYISKLLTKNVMNGYPNGTFQPDGSITRAEFCKALVLAMGWTSNAPSTSTFRDVPAGSWSASFIETAHLKGIVNGFPEGDFRPNNMVTRAEMAQMIALALKLSTTTSSYADTSDHWAKLYIGACANAGIVNGYADNMFKPNGFATRAEAAKMLVITMDKK